MKFVICYLLFEICDFNFLKTESFRIPRVNTCVLTRNHTDTFINAEYG